MKRRVSDMPVPGNDVQYGQTGRGAFSHAGAKAFVRLGEQEENRISNVSPWACRADGGANRAALNPV